MGPRHRDSRKRTRFEPRKVNLVRVGGSFLLLAGLPVCTPAHALTQHYKPSAAPTHPPSTSNDALKSPRQAPWTTTRSVSIRSVDWCGSKGMLPLQIYHGRAIGASPGHDRRQLHSLISIDPLSLSASSRIQSEHYESMSTHERSRLQQKIQAEARASQSLTPQEHLHVLYKDSAICVVHKPSGVLCVPGPRRNPSLANLVHSTFHVPIHVDKMIVHRLDMDTSGVVVYALQEEALSTLHADFRQRRVQKTYEALVCGHLRNGGVLEGEIHLPLERDPNRPPFMRVSLRGSGNFNELRGHVDGCSDSVLVSPANAKFLKQAPKPSETHFRILSYEHLADGSPVTRLELTPRTGRTHQLRVHCAAMGHAIVGDDIYGYGGEGSPYGGVGEGLCRATFGAVASGNVQRDIANLDRMLCLHARQLCIRHPTVGAPMIFQTDPDF